jgi:hypothetical protein
MNNNQQWSPEQTEEYTAWGLEHERFVAHGHTVSNIARTPDHARWMQQQEWLRNQGGGASSVR